MSAISKNQATAVGGLTIDQLQAEAISPDELNVSLSGIYQALANLETGLGSQLSGAGAVQGELRVFNATQAEPGWTEVDRSTPVPLQFAGASRSIMCSGRAQTTVSANTTTVCVAGEYHGSVYYMLGTYNNGGSTAAYLERMDLTTGKTYAVATHPNTSFSGSIGGFIPHCVIVGDYLYAYGGKGSDGYAVSATYRISLVSPGAGWTALQTMPLGRFSGGSPVVANSRIYVCGGVTGTGYQNTVLYFDTTTLSWVSVAGTIPYGACENAMTALTIEGNILCVGGWSGSGEVKKYAILNVSTGQFGPAYDLPTAWPDRPRALFRLAGQNVRGLCDTGSGVSVVEFNGTSWSDTGVAASLYATTIGRLELSDGCSFMAASNCYYTMPHCKHAHAAASKSRLLCQYTG